MCVVPGDYSIDEKTWVRKHLLPTGWAHPAGNLLCTYAAACEELQVSATSGVIAEVARRKALVAALPVHLLTNKSAAEATRCVLALHDHEAARALSVSQMQRIAAVLAPLQPWNELDVTPDAELHGRPAMSLPSCARVVSKLLGSSAQACRHSLLETLAILPDLTELSLRGKCRAVFRVLDVDCSGFLDLSEVLQIAPWVKPGCNVRDRQAALDTFAAWDANADGRVDLPELVDALAASLQGEPEQAVVAKLSDMLEQRFAGRFHWDVSRSRCGARGVLPLLRVLQKDGACESLDASGCGLDNYAVIALAHALHGHPGVRSLALRNNPISATGLAALRDLLDAEASRIVHLDVSGHLCLRGFSCTKHDGLGADAADTIDAELEAAVKRNRARAKASPHETMAILREHWCEVREMVGEATAHTGTASAAALCAALEAAAEGWGLQAGAIAALLHPERLFTGAIERCSSGSNEAPVDTCPLTSSDGSGTQPCQPPKCSNATARVASVELTRGECLAALDEREALKRVCRSIQHHLVEIKAEFFARSAASQAPFDDSDGEAAATSARGNEHTSEQHASSRASADGATLRVHIDIAPGGAGDRLRLHLGCCDAPADYDAAADQQNVGPWLPLGKIHDLLTGHLRDSSRGHGALASDAAAQLSCARFAECCDTLDGCSDDTELSWRQFIDTVLHCLHR